MKPAVPDVWIGRYRDALAPGMIRARGEMRGSRIDGLMASDVDEACKRLEIGLKNVLLVTEQLEAILISLIQRALAHAKTTYTEQHAALVAAYAGVECREGVVPMFLTGLAGVGKSRLRLVLCRILSGRRTIYVDSSHPAVPLIDFVDCVVGQKATPAAVLRTFASPEIAGGLVKVNQGELAAECARWLRLSGTCLIGVDETQFMSQSANASTLITKSLLSVADAQVPWFVIANYSLAWKLRRRPSEAQQRLLANPVVMLPDAADSADWGRLLDEYQVVMDDAIGFKLVEYRVEIWNLCAGLKRVLVNLLVHSYRIARLSGAFKASWTHVNQAYASVQFSVLRDDVNSLIANAGQGGNLRQDLQCPFTGPEVENVMSAYCQRLRAARAGTVAMATVESVMNASERSAIAEIKRAAAPKSEAAARVIKLAERRKPRTLDGLLEAGQDLLASLAKDPGSKT